MALVKKKDSEEPEVVEKGSQPVSSELLEQSLLSLGERFGLDSSYILQGFKTKGDALTVDVENSEYELVITIKDLVRAGIKKIEE